MEQAALPKPRFNEERGMELEVPCVPVESSELMDKPDRLMLETLQRVIVLCWFALMVVDLWMSLERSRI